MERNKKGFFVFQCGNMEFSGECYASDPCHHRVRDMNAERDLGFWFSPKIEAYYEKCKMDVPAHFKGATKKAKAYQEEYKRLMKLARALPDDSESL